MGTEEISDFQTIVQEWETLNKEFAQLENMQKSYSKAVAEFKRLKDEVQKQIKQHMSGVMRILQSLQSAKPSSASDVELKKKLVKTASARKEELRELQSSLPKDNGRYLRIVLGKVDVTLLNKDEKYKYKDEYERFKLAITVIILLLSVLIISFPSSRTFDALLNFLLVWYYCTLTIRESILKVNGSRIKGWWRTHHFITTVLAGVLITWPDGVTYHRFRMHFMWYSCYTSFLQFLQYNYQQGCLYRLRALGERYNMDITMDGFHSWMWRGLKFLLPFLTIGYAWQLYNAYILYQVCITTEVCEWQVSATSLIFLVLFVGNTMTTGRTVFQKINLTGLISRKQK